MEYRANLQASQQLCDALQMPLDKALIASRKLYGRERAKFVKRDVIANTLNQLFGPLGWSLETSDRELSYGDYVKEDRQNGDKQMATVDAVITVKLTVHAARPDAADVIYMQTGVGFGEGEANKNRKMALGMAVKGAETDGLKRCASLLGKALGMFLTKNGEQDDVLYAHGDVGNDHTRKQELASAQQLRRNQNRARGSRDGGDLTNQRSDGALPPPANGQNKQNGPAPGTQQAPTQQPPSAQTSTAPAEPRPAAGQQGAQQPAAKQAADKTRPADPPQQDNPVPAPAPAGQNQQSARPPANTNFNLSQIPVSSEDQRNWAATFCARVDAARQETDKVSLIEQHSGKIADLDAEYRDRLYQRVKECGVDIHAILGE